MSLMNMKKTVDERRKQKSAVLAVFGERGVVHGRIRMRREGEL